MSRYRRYKRHSNYDYPEYVSVGEKRSRNNKAIAKLRKRDPDIRPVVIEGRGIARSWWGKSWNANLERYADYHNRIERGRSYVRHGAVLDLRIESGTVSALVQGSRGKPYTVEVTIKALPKSVWEQLREASAKCLDSLTDLLGGKFPKALKDTFFEQGTGLFPSPKEISFSCSCPDWASMCKHVASVLYGIGNRLDASPELLFRLRQVTIDELITQTIDATAKGLVSKAAQATGDDILDDADLGDVFGIEMDLGDIKPIALPPVADGKHQRKTTKKTAKKGKSKGATAKSRTGGKPTPARVPAKRRGRSSPAGPPRSGEMIEQLVAVFGRSRRRFSSADLLVKLPEWSRAQVANTLQRALASDRVERVERGVYRPI